MTEQRQILDVLMIAIAGTLADLHTATIAKVTKVDEKTISCQPVINRVVEGQSIELPEFAEVPPFFFGGGDSFMSFPVAVGDYCLLIFTERCFDRWWNGQDNQDPAELRMHDYSDGIALCGLKNLAGAITIPDETTINGVTRIGSENPSDQAVAAQALQDALTTAADAAAGAAVPQDGGKVAFQTFSSALAGLASQAGDPKVKIK
jgi:hypothetical protein